MAKKLGLYLLVAVIAYALGTASSLQAESKEGEITLLQLNQKLDKVLTNQEEIKTQLKRIFNKC